MDQALSFCAFPSEAKAGAKKKVAPKSVQTLAPKKALDIRTNEEPVLGFARFKVLELRIGTKPTVVVTSRPDEPDRRGWLDQTKRYRRVSIGMSFWELRLFFGTIRL